MKGLFVRVGLGKNKADEFIYLLGRLLASLVGEIAGVREAPKVYTFGKLKKRTQKAFDVKVGDGKRLFSFENISNTKPTEKELRNYHYWCNQQKVSPITPQEAEERYIKNFKAAVNYTRTEDDIKEIMSKARQVAPSHSLLR